VEHENEHLDIREKLLRLPKIQADDNFLKRLQIQIDVLDSEERTRDVVVKGSASGYFKNLFGARLMPALGISSVVVAAFLVYFVLADKKEAVVNDVTGNKNTETIITPEKPGNTSSAPLTENKQLATTESTDSQDKNTTKNDDVTDRNSKLTKSDMPKVINEKDASQTLGVPNKESKIEVQVRSGKTNEDSKVVAPAEVPAVTEESGKVNTQDALKSPDAKVKTETKKPDNPLANKEQEKTVQEGGRGNTDSKAPKSNIKPKKKTVDGVKEINKSVLETLRDKLK